MPTDLLILVATACLAVVAIVAAVVAVRAARRIATVPEQPAEPLPAAAPETPVLTLVTHPEPEPLPARVVDGRVIVPPSRDDVVATALSRPGARLVVLAHGIAHALRPESRDRIAALMRREYRRRRRERMRAARRATRAAVTSPPPAADSWLGEAPERRELSS